MTTQHALMRRAAAAAGVAAAAVVLSACGSTTHDDHTTSARPSASSARHNAADVSFAQGMIPHHRQALEMAELAATRAASPEVRSLAVEIRKAQDPEIRTMSGWLAAWGEPVPAAGASGEHGGHAMSGMMTDQEMEDLGNSSGKAFDTAFLTLMVEHHRGAVEMARSELDNGAHRPAKDLARAVVTAQTNEIDRMNKLLGEK
ncbi:DUF305 domain-containing protein [Streptomyces spinoverrucosus]|uniref:DUF305 domain-containing protein n=1 Tax=Streptomyces spinoverrucosus TaxID=284043 RepID=UPI0018C4432D|nr:DUF305 domain-containing protein [Streptomyces spinoverrucosus]MBG0851876.1 DUF305 domain-containing protein [Streptomyces spinoverrucosus]